MSVIAHLPARRVAAVLVVSVATAIAGAAPAVAKTRHCGQIAFAPNTDFGAFRIVAKNVSCTTARKVARASRDLNVIKGPFRYRSHGFSCRGTLDTSSLPSVEWVCKRGDARVTFSRS